MYKPRLFILLVLSLFKGKKKLRQISKTLAKIIFEMMI